MTVQPGPALSWPDAHRLPSIVDSKQIASLFGQFIHSGQRTLVALSRISGVPPDERLDR